MTTVAILASRDNADNLNGSRKGLKHKIDSASALQKPTTFAEAVDIGLGWGIFPIQ